MIFRQLFEAVSCTYTYVLACPRTKKALVIDPVLEMVSRDAELMQQLGLTAIYGLNTHIHADHITGTGELKHRCSQMRSVLSSKAGGKADLYVDHGQTLAFGDEQLEVRATPGHTSGCLTYVCHKHRMAFTGDALLIRGCGRTDFQNGDARQLYRSVHENILSLPDDYVLFPAHDYTGRTVTSVGEEKKFNPRLIKSEDEFVEIMHHLNLPYPHQIDKAVPANIRCGLFELMDENLQKKVRCE
ncbi:protein ETHE1 [Aphelenchoides avenae]|nr:protein ETHE1 [Aphelenchus avenae]